MAPVEARTTETVPLPSFVTQMFDPSKVVLRGSRPTVTVWITAPKGPSLSSVAGPVSVTHMFVPSKTGAVGCVNPAVTVEKVHGIAPGVTITTHPSGLVVQKRPPSKATPPGKVGSVLTTVVTTPAAFVGSMEYIRPTGSSPVTTMRPIADSTPQGSVEPVHVSSSLPSLARTRETVDSLRFVTQMSAPSKWAKTGKVPTVVRPITREFCGLQYLTTAARRLERWIVRSTVRERKAAIWRRVTLPEGS